MFKRKLCPLLECNKKYQFYFCLCVFTPMFCQELFKWKVCLSLHENVIFYFHCYIFDTNFWLTRFYEATFRKEDFVCVYLKIYRIFVKKFVCFYMNISFLLWLLSFFFDTNVLFGNILWWNFSKEKHSYFNVKISFILCLLLNGYSFLLWLCQYQCSLWQDFVKTFL